MAVLYPNPCYNEVDLLCNLSFFYFRNFRPQIASVAAYWPIENITVCKQTIIHI